jgi:DnaJ family protein C protein 7
VITLLKEISDKKYEVLLYRIRNVELIKKKGNDLYEQKNYQEAIKEYTKALELDPTNKKYNSIILINRALCFQKIEKYNSAINDVNQSIKINPNYARAYVKKANVFLKI